MAAMTPADALRLAINALKDVAESGRMPSGLTLGQASLDLHAEAAETLEETLAALTDHE